MLVYQRVSSTSPRFRHAPSEPASLTGDSSTSASSVDSFDSAQAAAALNPHFTTENGKTKKHDRAP